jgi:uncharacterized protein YprB with RNaseH-like and TPR domain
VDQISCCVFDLETSGLNADFGVILCGVVKGAGDRPMVFRGDELNPNWTTRRSDDSGVLKAIVSEMSRYDIWIAHNGAKFDVPFLRTRLAKWGLPALPAKKLVDPVQLARNKFKMSFNGLAQVASLLGVNSKTDLDPDVWIRASLDGDRKAMGYIVKHCVEDVYTLEKVVRVLKDYATNLNSWGSGF